VADVTADIDWYAAHSDSRETAFIGDADPLCRPLDESVTILAYLKGRFPQLSRITVYARAGTLYKLGAGGLKRLADAGLTRVHAGLESGDLATLKFHCKGQSPKLVIDAARMTREAGIELSFYVLLGLGGAGRWKEHIDGTAAVISATDPEFIRLRRIWLFTQQSTQAVAVNPLWSEIDAGTFTQQTPEGTVLELRRLVAGIGGVTSHLVCDHPNNYVSVEGDFPRDQARMLAEIDAFLALPREARERHYLEVGSRI
jgi:hypothetical protein